MLIFVAIVLISQSIYNFLPHTDKSNDTAATFFVPGISVQSLVQKYTNAPYNGKVKILIVPGHEPYTGGTAYGTLRERTLNLQLGTELRDYLAQNPRFEVTMSRDENGWNPSLLTYVNNNAIGILSWQQMKEEQMSQLIDAGKVTLVDPTVEHPDATPYAGLFLYGINKWASENQYDIAIHIHFNDNARHYGWPRYHGFVIYAPEYQYSNSSSSLVLAKSLFDEIYKIQYISTEPGERVGIVPEQSLIAIGEYNTSDTLAVLIEYAYIYEHVMLTKYTRDRYINKAAYATAQGINNFFNQNISSINP